MGILGDKLREYAERLKDREDFFIADVKRHQYFASNPKNDTDELVRQKVSVVNNHQIHELSCHEAIIKHILSLNIDVPLQQGDLTLVDRIATFHYLGKDYHLLVFASEYCNSHRPDVFPIYNRKHLVLLKQYMEAHDLLEEGSSLEDYLVFKKGLDHLLERYQLHELLNYYEVKKLDWLYLDKILAEVAKDLD